MTCLLRDKIFIDTQCGSRLLKVVIPHFQLQEFICPVHRFIVAVGLVNDRYFIAVFLFCVEYQAAFIQFFMLMASCSYSKMYPSVSGSTFK